VPTLRDVEVHDAVFILGEDLTQTAARLALALRQTVKGKATEIAASMKIPQWHMAAVQNVAQDALHPLFIASVTATRLDDIAEACVHAAPADLARIGFAVAHAIDPSAPAVNGLDADVVELVQLIAQALLEAKRPLIVSGASLGEKSIIEAAANIAGALKNREKNASISLVVPEANSMGLALLLGETFAGKSVDDALQALTAGQANAVIVLENDLYRRADAATVDAALAAADVVIVADHQHTATSAKAQLLLPVASFAEGDGTLVSFEGRAQRFFQVFEPSYYDASILIREGWRWLHALHGTLQGKSVDWTQLDEVTAACAAANTLLARIGEAAPNASFRIRGMKLAREPHRYSGRTAMRANISVHEPRQPQDKDTAFAFSMEGYSGSVEARQQIPFAWSPGWNSPQAWNKFQDEVGGHLRAGDPGVRLLETQGAVLPWFSVPAAFNPAPGTLQAVALHHLFGSDETSARAAPLQTRIPQAYVLLAKAEADRLGVNDGALLSLVVAGQPLRLPLQISEELAIGVVGLPVGLPGIPALIAGAVVSHIEEAAQ
jgi:NADH-quinone oxidoreductase subunit G